MRKGDDLSRYLHTNEGCMACKHYAWCNIHRNGILKCQHVDIEEIIAKQWADTSERGGMPKVKRLTRLDRDILMGRVYI